MVDNGAAKALFKRMQAEGVFAPTTYWMDVDLHSYVAEAREAVESPRG